MTDSIQKKIQDATDEMLDSLDREYLRKLQKQMYLCSSDCCDDGKASMESMQHCVTQCARRVHMVQQYMTNELQNFQDRLNRCSMQCKDAVEDKLNSKSKNETKSMIAMEKMFNECVSKCAEDHVNLLPGIKRRAADYIKSLE
ncbi:Uncharacterized protein T4B_8780 [Trichinella pseudospiralis]|uniref:Protein FAM136A n=2 Tax=Trichinella pseudospiralis TaxID=6337 RepID=A0A0V1G5I3_TRIPS|nr:Uncharacterized protein T4E_7237 [Trichinella pseudospiralis]KRY75108.1 Uncharacterized protein T4A_332 [Trichinella pseudospiralis]KRY93536.1 Uncharacterized protein T4D_770 [Trichinella pseudospiralis]KRZ19890.1 Uncharacterized protein T4B_8780 [Trichinella pseudospiralis]KRZ43433.1 Uncharacterized protein T4C_5326 [Trichinella pseudospiralis]